MGKRISHEDWHIPFRKDEITLREAYDFLQLVGAGQQEIPLMIQLIENPRYKIPGITLFHGAVDLRQHDFIHLVLGRGLLPKDEAFAIGFTMGSTNKVSTSEEALFGWISQTLYPAVYKFHDDEIKVFKDAVKLAAISQCDPLDEVDFEPLLDKPLAEVRRTIGLEYELLLAYFAIEKRRFPDARESQRLV